MRRQRDAYPRRWLRTTFNSRGKLPTGHRSAGGPGMCCRARTCASLARSAAMAEAIGRSESVRGRWRRSEECASEKSDERQNQRRAEQLPPNSASSARSSVLAGSPPIEYWNIVGVRTRRLATLAATHTTMRANSQREMGCCCLLASPASPRLSLGARSFLPSPAARHLCTRSRIARCISVRNHCSLVWFVWLQLVWFGFNTHWQLLIISFVCYLCAKLFETCPPRSPWKQRARVSARASAITTRTRTRSRMYNKLQVCNLQ